MIYLQDRDFTLHQGDVREVLAELEDGSVDCVITSPPYWGLRDYNAVGQIGLEPSPAAFVETMVAVFREVRRVLAPHGTCWINLGSSYFSGASRGSGPNQSLSPPRDPAYGSDGRGPQDSPDPGSAYHDLCDECLTDWTTHRDHTERTVQPQGLSAPPLEPTARDTALADYGSASLVASPPDVPASTTLESWRQLRGECSRCSSRASSLSSVRSSSRDAPEFSRMSWLNYSRKLKPKDLVPIPWMVAMALQEDGWYLRSDIVWSKLNPMPESVTDRPTSAHEHVFLLTRQPRYWFDAEAVREPAIRAGDIPGGNNHRAVDEFGVKPHSPFNGTVPAGRNIRNVWEIATQPYAEAHFATYPEELVRRCLLAGCPEWVCRVCGAPRERIVERTPFYDHSTTKVTALADRNDLNGEHDVRHGVLVSTQTLGWSDCGHNAYRPGIVLDPFLGSGTTAYVARRHARHTIGIELSAEYCALIAERTQQLSLEAELVV